MGTDAGFGEQSAGAGVRVPGSGDREDEPADAGGECRWRVAQWAALYEPPRRDVKTDGSLRWVRWRVFGHALSESYRLLFELAGSTDAALAWGLFSRLVEIAADEERGRRDGTIYWRGRPADAAGIAFLTLFEEPIVRRCLAILSHPDIGWVERIAATPSATQTRAAVTATAPQPPAACDTALHPDDTTIRNETVRERYDTRPADAGGAERAPSLPRRGSDSLRGEQSSDSTLGSGTGVRGPGSGKPGSPLIKPANAGPNPGSRMRILAQLMDSLHVRTPAATETTPFAKQLRADRTTLERIVDHMIANTVEGMDLQERFRPVLELARAMGNCAPGDRMKRFVRRAKESGWTPVNWGVTDAA